MNVNIETELSSLYARLEAKDYDRKRTINEMIRAIKWATDDRIEDLQEIAVSICFYEKMKALGKE